MRQLHQVAGNALSAAQHVQRANTLREVRDFGHVVVPGYLKVQARSLPEFRRLKAAQEQRASELVNADLARLDALATEDKPASERLESVKQAYGTLTHRQWVFLRSEHPGILSQAIRHVQRLIGQLDKEAKSAS